MASIEERKEKFNQILYSMIGKLDGQIDENNEALHRIYNGLAITTEPEYQARSASSEQGQKIFNLVAKAEQFKNGLQILERELSIQFPLDSDIHVGKGDGISRDEFAELAGLEPPGAAPVYGHGMPDLGGMPDLSGGLSSYDHGMPDLSGLPDLRGMPSLTEGGRVDSFDDPDSYQSTAVGQGAFEPPWLTSQKSAEEFKKRERAALVAKAGTRAAAALAGAGSDLSGTTPDTDKSEFSTKVTVFPKGSKFPINFVCRLYRHKYWIGEPIKVWIDFHNMSSATGKSVVITLYKRTVLRKIVNDKGTFYIYQEKKPVLISQQPINPIGFPVKPKNRHRKDVTFKIPFKITPSSSDCRIGEFPIVYHMEVAVLTNKQKTDTRLKDPPRLGLFGGAMHAVKAPPPKSLAKVKPEPDVKRPSFEHDFVCVSEFSELVGPVPLFNIPEGGEGSFNLEDFVIRIMAVDCQNRTVDPGSFMEDSMVVISEPSEDAFAYVHHFTLLDIFARGYVRPICMSYITRDPTKIMDNFVFMMERFSEISTLLKEGNQIVFLRDLETRLRDLRLTKDVLEREEHRRVEEGDGGSLADGSFDFGSCPVVAPSPHMVRETMEEIEAMRKRLHQSLLRQGGVSTRDHSLESKSSNRAHYSMGAGADAGQFTVAGEDTGLNELRISETGRVACASGKRPSEAAGVSGKSEGAVEVGEGANPPAVHMSEEEETLGGEDESSLLALSSADGPERGDSENNSPGGDEEIIPPPVDSLSDELTPELTELFSRMGFSPSEYEPKVVKSFHKGQRFEKLRELGTPLCGPQFNGAVGQLKSLHQYFRRLNIVLTLEGDDFSLLEPRSSLLTVGGSVLANFNLQASRHTALAASLPLDPRGTLPAPPSSPGKIGRGGVASARHPSKTDPSSTSKREASSSSKRGASSPNKREASSPNKVSKGAKGTKRNSLGRRSASLAVPAPMASGELLDTVQEDSSSSDESDEYRSPHGSFTSLSPTMSDVSDSGSEELLSAYTTGMLPPPRTPLTHTGRGLAEVLRKYPFARHVVYSLLKGRPLVVYGRPEAEGVVRRLVRTLALFVVGGRQVQPWREEPLRMPHLAGLALVGLCKACPIPKAVEKYVSILDYEGQWLVAPPYTGALVDDLLGYRSLAWPDEETLLAHVHYKLLNISTQACLYYHLCCVPTDAQYGHPAPGKDTPRGGSNHTSFRTYENIEKGRRGRADPKSLSDGHILASSYLPLPLAVRDQEKANFFKRVTNKAQDRELIIHLAEVVKEQQAEEVQHAPGAPPVIHLDYSKCAVFKRQKEGKRETKTRTGGLFSV